MCAWSLCRFNLEELQRACGEVADIEVTLQQSTCQSMDGLAKLGQRLDEADDMDTIHDNEDEVVSDAELEDLHGRLSSQRQQSSQIQVTQPADDVQENLTSGGEDASAGESDEDDAMDLSQALLQKLDESFAGDLVEDDDQISPGAVEQEGNVCDELNEPPSPVQTCDSDQLMLAVLDSSGMETDDVNSSSAVKLSEDCQDDEPVLCSKLRESCVAVTVEGEKNEDEQMIDSVQKDSAMSDTLKDSQISVSTIDSDDRLPSAGKNMAVNDSSSLVTKLPESDSKCDDKTCPDDDVAENKPASQVPSAESQSRFYSTASPESLFEQSSLDQCDLEQLNSSSDIPASAADNLQTSDASFANIDEAANRCESPNDLFDSPTSHKSTYSPPTSPQTDVMCQQDDKTPSSPPKSASFPVGNGQLQLDVLPQEGHQTPRSSQKSPSSPREIVDILTKQDSQSTSVAAEVDMTDVIVLEVRPPILHSTESDATSVLCSSTGCRPGSSGENGSVPKRSSLRKVRAKTRNSLSSDDVNLSYCSSGVRHTPRRHSGQRHRHVYSDVEPDSDDDVSENHTVKSRVSCRVSLFNGSASKQSTQECYVKLIRIRDADLLPQVKICSKCYSS